MEKPIHIFFLCVCVFVCVRARACAHTRSCAFAVLGPYPRHMEVPRLGVELELLPPAYTRATAMPDLSHVCELYHSSQQCWMLNPRSEARDRTRNLMVPSQICFCCAMMENPSQEFLSENLGTTVLGHRVG